MADREGDKEDDEEIGLSQSTLSILNQFLTEKQDMEEKASKDPFAENWAMSQFWYTEDTASRVADEMVRVADGGSIACLACPSLFRNLRKRYPKQHAHLFEYDERFEVLGDFAFWDYNDPLNLPLPLQHSFKVLIADPPYLSAECLEKTIQSMKLLGAEGSKYFALTGASVADTARHDLQLWPVTWRPEHKSKLGNEFCFYTQLEETAQRFGGWDTSYRD